MQRVKNYRKRQVILRCTGDEYETIAAASKNKKITIARYIREAAIAINVKPAMTINREQWIVLSKIAGNLATIAKRSLINEADEKEAREAVQQLREALLRIKK